VQHVVRVDEQQRTQPSVPPTPIGPPRTRHSIGDIRREAAPPGTPPSPPTPHPTPETACSGCQT
jgi:hypothetical protein